MKKLALFADVGLKLFGLIQVVGGILFWTGNARQLIPMHMAVGVLLVLLLWIMAGMALRARVNTGLVLFAAAWGVVLPALGVAQLQLQPGDLHWIIQVLHLAVGMVAVGLGTLLRRLINARPAMRAAH